VDTSKNKDPRLERIQEMLLKFNAGDFSARETVSEKGDELDAIIIALNTLGEEAQSSGKLIRDYEKRVSSIMDVLLKYTVFDFSEKAEVSPAGDELDAIAIGLNTLAEELVASHEAEVKQLNSIQEINHFLDTVLENLPNLVFVRDIDSRRYLRVNKAVEAFLGLTKEDIIGKTNYDLFPEKFAEQYSKDDEQVLNSKEILDIAEELVPTKRGDKWLHTKKMTISENGKGIYLLGISEEITQRKINEKLIRENESRMRMIIEGVRDYAIFMLDPNGYILNWNAGAERIKGYKAEEVIGKHFSIFYLPKDIENGRPAHNLEMAKKLGRYEDESIRKRKDGSTFWADVVFTALYSDKNELTGFSKITRDVTERHMADLKVKELNAELAHHVKQLENTNKELESFSYSVSHDLRAPLRAIHGYTKILEDEYGAKLDKDARQMMQSVMANAKKMGQLIDDLLAFSRLGKKELEKTQVNMDELIHLVIAEIKKGQENLRAEIKVNKLPDAWGDTNLLHQVFTNIISNAVKYSSLVEKPMIEIGGKEEKDETIYYIKDNGAGFDMKYYDKLFGIFQRLHDSHEFEGTGVGLALVKRIIVRHDGRVWAESEVGKGSTFYVALKKETNSKK
jgi:PAS domain S-box-containing protein